MGTNGFIFLLLSTFTLAILITYLISNLPTTNPPPLFLHTHFHGSSSSATKSWPELEFNWRLALATVIALLGSAFGTVGGVGGGGIFVPVLTLLVGFDSKSAAAISKCMIMGASASSVWYNMRVHHPTKVDTPIIDYDIALVFQPLLMLGITIGVTLSVAFPYWLVTLLIIILFVGTSTRSFVKGVDMWKAETLSMLEMEKRKRSRAVYDTAEIEPLVHKVEMSKWQIVCMNLEWKTIVVMTLAWLSFLLLQIIKNDLVVCSKWYWVVFILQVPVGFGVLGYKSIKLYREKRKPEMGSNTERIGEPSVRWCPTKLAACALCGIAGGTVGGLLGSGGGFVLGPLLLEMGVIPQVASATATFVMMYSSSLSVVEFYLLKRFPVPYGAYLTGVRKVMEEIVRRGSVIVFILSAVIFSSAVFMGAVGIQRSMTMVHDGDFLGFFSLCSPSFAPT